MSSGIETNKIVGAILTALLVTVGIGHFGAALFDSGGHGEAELAYPVAAGPVEAEPEGPEIIPTVLPLLADASAADGEALFGACKGCHTAAEGGPNTVGPNLWGVVGRPIGSHEGYSYSDAMASFGGDWTYDQLNEFLYNPRADIDGTKMTFAGIPQLESRANMIAYLRTLSNDPLPLPTQEEIDSAVAAQQADAGGDEAAEPGDEATDEDVATDEADAPEATDSEATVDESEAVTDEADAPEATETEAAPDEGDAADEAVAPTDEAEPEATEPESATDETATEEADAPDAPEANVDEAADESEATDDVAAPVDEVEPEVTEPETTEPETTEPEATSDDAAGSEDAASEDDGAADAGTDDSATPEPAADETAEEPADSDG